MSSTAHPSPAVWIHAPAASAGPWVGVLVAADALVAPHAGSMAEAPAGLRAVVPLTDGRMAVVAVAGIELAPAADTGPRADVGVVRLREPVPLDPRRPLAAHELDRALARHAADYWRVLESAGAVPPGVRELNAPADPAPLDRVADEIPVPVRRHDGEDARGFFCTLFPWWCRGADTDGNSDPPSGGNRP